MFGSHRYFLTDCNTTHVRQVPSLERAPYTCIYESSKIGNSRSRRI